MRKLSKINQIKFCGEGLKKRLGIRFVEIFVRDQSAYPSCYNPNAGTLMVNLSEHKKWKEMGATTLISKMFDFEDSNMNQLLHSVAHELTHALRHYKGIFDKLNRHEYICQIEVLAYYEDWSELDRCRVYYRIPEEWEANQFGSCIVRHKDFFFKYKSIYK